MRPPCGGLCWLLADCFNGLLHHSADVKEGGEFAAVGRSESDDGWSDGRSAEEVRNVLGCAFCISLTVENYSAGRPAAEGVSFALLGQARGLSLVVSCYDYECIVGDAVSDLVELDTLVDHVEIR